MKGPYSRRASQTDGTAFNYKIFDEYLRWYRSESTPYDHPLPFLHFKSFWVEPLPPNQWLNHPCNQECGGALIANAAGGFNTPLGTGSMAEVHNKAYSRFVGKVQAGLKLGANLAEIGQTRQMILGILHGLRNPVSVLAAAFHRYAKKHPEKQAQWIAQNVAMRDIPGAWLAFHFGVEPLYKDLWNAFDAYLLRYPDMHYSSSAKGSWTATVSPSGSNLYDHRYTFNAVARVAGKVSFREDNMATLASVGLINPLQPAWEVLPYSFVVDWFYPVGQLIDSMTDLYHIDVADCYQSWLLQCDSRYRYVKTPWNKTWRNNTAMRFERTLINKPKMVIPPLRVPGPWSKTRLATAASLVLNAFSTTGFKVR